MQVDTAEIHGVSNAVARQKAGKRTLKTLTSLDQRTTAARRAAALVATFAGELGGQLTDVQRVAVQNAAALVAIAEDAQTRRLAGDNSVSLDEVVRASSAARRAINDLHIRAPAERDYMPLRERWAEEADDEAADGAGELAHESDPVAATQPLAETGDESTASTESTDESLNAGEDAA
jgi:hypothetical protein